MSFREDEREMANQIEDLERRMRRVEQGGANPPDAGFVLRMVGDDMHYIYVPSGTQGPVIGSR